MWVVTELGQSHFGRANLSDADLSDASLQDPSIITTNLSGVDMSGTTMHKVQSEGIRGTPKALPDGWTLEGGRFHRP